jgi:hypothetical protein
MSQPKWKSFVALTVISAEAVCGAPANVPKTDFEEEKSEKGTVREDKIRRSKWLCVFKCFEKFDARAPYKVEEKPEQAR